MPVVLGDAIPLDSLGGDPYPPLNTTGESPLPPHTDLLPGTLDALILKAVSLQRHHGYGVMMRIQQITAGAFRIEEGALYPALHRLEHQGYLAGEWGVSGNNRRAKYYKLTTTGRKRLTAAMHNWQRLAKAMELAFNARAEEV